MTMMQAELEGATSAEAWDRAGRCEAPRATPVSTPYTPLTSR